MKKSIITYCCILLAGASLMSGCKKDEAPGTGGGETGVQTKTVISLNGAEKIYFNLSTGESVPASAINATNWDISFLAAGRGASIAVNSGSEGTGNAGIQLIETGFDDLEEAPADGYKTGSEATPDFMVWANYTGSATEPKHAVLPKAGLTLVVKTADGKFSKIQLLSLYEGNPNTTTPQFADLSTRPAFGFFSFRYATQTDGSRKF
jgi:hypothetical protein